MLRFCVCFCLVLERWLQFLRRLAETFMRKEIGDEKGFYDNNGFFFLCGCCIGGRGGPGTARNNTLADKK